MPETRCVYLCALIFKKKVCAFECWHVSSIRMNQYLAFTCHQRAMARTTLSESIVNSLGTGQLRVFRNALYKHKSYQKTHRLTTLYL